MRGPSRRGETGSWLLDGRRGLVAAVSCPQELADALLFREGAPYRDDREEGEEEEEELLRLKPPCVSHVSLSRIWWTTQARQSI